MNKSATNIEQQVKRLIERGLIINDIEKTKEVLCDIGYYRLGFYWYYFEKCHKNHLFKEGANFDDVVKLYYLDFDLKHLLSKYIHRIEVHFRTQLVYIVSNHYSKQPLWYVDESIIKGHILKEFNNIYFNIKKGNKVLSKHHNKYPNEAYAPAWKTMEFLTFGQIFKFYNCLKNEKLKTQIAEVYGFRDYKLLENFFVSIIKIRNICSHNAVLYDFNQPIKIRNIPNKHYRVKNHNHNNLNASIRLILFILSKVSKNRAIEAEREIKLIFSKFDGSDFVKKIVAEKINFDL